MLYSTSIAVETVDEDEFLDLVNRLAKVSGQKVEIRKQIVIWTDSPDLTSILDSLADAIRSGESFGTAEVVRKNGHKKPIKKLGGGKRKAEGRMNAEVGSQNVEGEKRTPTRGPHVRSIKIESTGELISRFELDKRLRERTLDPGSQLHSPKHGTMTVKNNVPPGEPYLVVNLVGEVISKGGGAESS